VRKKITRGGFHPLTKTIAVIVCLCMVSTEIVYAAPLPSSPNPPQNESPKAITIPEELGSVEETHQGRSGKTIIYIQDAHDSLEAQENIAKIINFLVENHGVETVFEEGYEGPVPSDEYFGFIDDPVIKERVAYFLMDKLRIGGAEYAHINRKQDFNLIGADDIDLHLENIEWYRESAKRREQISGDLQEIEKHIKKLANKYFPKEMKKWMKLKRRLDHDKLSLLDYLRRTMSLRTTAGNAAINAYPNINLLLAAEKSHDPKVVEETKQIEAKTLFKEIERLEDDLAESTLHHERDRKIFRYYKGIQLLKRLNAIEVTSEEYAVIKDSITALNTEDIARFIVKHTHKALVLSKRWEESIRHAIKFYELAEARDLVLADSLKQASDETSVLVFGGFHKENIKSILRASGFSYHIITPKITEISEKHHQYYARLMSLGKNRPQVSSMLLKAARAASEILVASQNQEYQMAFKSEVRMLVNVFKNIRSEGALTIEAMDLAWSISDLPSASPRSEMRQNGDEAGDLKWSRETFGKLRFGTEEIDVAEQFDYGERQVIHSALQQMQQASALFPGEALSDQDIKRFTERFLQFESGRLRNLTLGYPLNWFGPSHVRILSMLVLLSGGFLVLMQLLMIFPVNPPLPWIAKIGKWTSFVVFVATGIAFLYLLVSREMLDINQRSIFKLARRTNTISRNVYQTLLSDLYVREEYIGKKEDK